jgi:GNAT superfamily N-acetyltransferase
MNVLFIRTLWIDERFRGNGHGKALIESIEGEARRFGAVRSYLDTLSVQAPDFYRDCGYETFGTIEGYPGGVTRYWFTKAL